MPAPIQRPKRGGYATTCPPALPQRTPLAVHRRLPAWSRAGRGSTGRQYTIQDFLGSTSYSGASFSPDNRRFWSRATPAASSTSTRFPSAGRAHAAHRLDRDSYFSIGYFPADERFLFTADQGGNELNHLYVRELDGTETDLTPGENLKAQFDGWADDDASFFVGTNERDQRFFDSTSTTSEPTNAQLLYQNDEGYSFGDISTIVAGSRCTRTTATPTATLPLRPRDRGLTPPHPHEGESTSSRPVHADGKGLVLVTDQDSEFTTAWSTTWQRASARVLARPTGTVSSPATPRTASTCVVDQQRRPHRAADLRTASGEQLDLPEVPNANITSLGISRDESHMAFYASSSRMPSDLFVQELPDGEPRRLTNSINPNIDPETWSKPRWCASPRSTASRSRDSLQAPQRQRRRTRHRPCSGCTAARWPVAGRLQRSASSTWSTTAT